MSSPSHRKSEPAPSVTHQRGAAASTRARRAADRRPRAGLAVYLILGVLFGIVLTRSEVISWYRIQEMFRFQSFRMYGIIGTAVLTAALSLQVIRRFGVRTIDGHPIETPPKTMGRGTRYWLGGTFFGLGWALVGACPGPLFALIGNGVSVIFVVVLSALAGTFTYGALRPRLPH